MLPTYFEADKWNIVVLYSRYNLEMQPSLSSARFGGGALKQDILHALLWKWLLLQPYTVAQQRCQSCWELQELSILTSLELAVLSNQKDHQKTKRRNKSSSGTDAAEARSHHCRLADKSRLENQAHLHKKKTTLNSDVYEYGGCVLAKFCANWSFAKAIILQFCCRWALCWNTTSMLVNSLRKNSTQSLLWKLKWCVSVEFYHRKLW